MTDRLHSSNASAVTLNETVIAGGYCVGCGACATANEAFEMHENRDGFLQAALARDKEPDGPDAPSTDYMRLCPMSGAAEDETSIARKLFDSDCNYTEGVGYWRNISVGHMADQGDRERGSSGGLVTWLVRELLIQRRVDYVVHVKRVESPASGELLYHYGISSSVADLEQGRGSAYYPITMSSMIDVIRSRPGRYAIVTIPCFAKAIRLLSQRDAVLRERLTFVVGIVCGHLKSRFFSEYMAWTVGVRPADLSNIKFRRKIAGSPASRYGIAAQGRHMHSGHPVDLYFGTSWELGFMKYKACDYCDDVFAETADIVFGDAWLADYVEDWRGHNVVVTRSSELDHLLAEGVAAGAICLDKSNVQEAIESQSSGLRHRREGLAVRLAWADSRGTWRPGKRVVADGAAVDPHRRATYLKRALLSDISVRRFRKAKRAGLLSIYYAMMAIPVFRYYLYQHGLLRAVKETVPGKAFRRAVFITKRWGTRHA